MNQPVGIHRDPIFRPQVKKLPRMFGAGRNLGHGDIFEHGLERMEQVQVFLALIIGFLLWEPLGLAKIYNNLRNYFLVWPFRHAQR